MSDSFWGGHLGVSCIMWRSTRRGNSPCVAFWFCHTVLRLHPFGDRNNQLHVIINYSSHTMSTPRSRSSLPYLFPMADTADRNEAEPSDISSALDVEQLDLNLYRSKRNLSLNFDTRGVFGGQVISQALVAATNCVKPEFTLHVRTRPTLH